MSGRARAGGVCASAAIAIVLAAGCGGEGSVVGPRDVTDEEAGRMAETLFANYDAGGADFDLDARLPEGTRISLSGQVDFAGHVGRATVSADGGPDAHVTEVVWTRDRVFERIPDLTELARTLDVGVADWYVRRPDPDARALDAMIELVTSLAGEQRDNPVLVAQTDGTAWLRGDTVPGSDIAVDVLRYGPRTVFWIERGGVTLLRFEGDNADGTRPVVIDLRDHGLRSIDVPPGGTVVESGTIAELYAAATTAPDE